MMKKRYLTLRTLGDALTLMKTTFPPSGGSMTIPIAESEGRVASEPVYARYTVPDSSIAEMDGIAVKSSTTLGAGEQRPLALTDFVRVDTGNMIPPDYDAVIMIEDVSLEESSCIVRKAARPGQHIRPPGQDITKGDLIIPRGHQIRFSDISALATYGYDTVTVRIVRVGILPTGNELVPIGTVPGPGQVIETNSLFAASFLSRLGALCTTYPLVRDNPLQIAQALEKAVFENDLVLMSSGTSAGRHDYSAETIMQLGRLLFHGVAILPGKPAMLGAIRGKPVVGLPGYPVGSQTVLREIVAPFLVSWGLAPLDEWIIRGRLARDMPSDLGFDEYVPVSAGAVNGTSWIFPHPRGSGLQMNLIRANGYLHIPLASEGWEAGEWVDIHCTSLPHQIERTLLCIGAKNPGTRQLAYALANHSVMLQTFDDLSSRALLALRKNSCHLVALTIPDLYGDIGAGYPWNDTHAVVIHLGKIPVGIVSHTGAGIADLDHLRVVHSPKGSTGRILIDRLIAAKEIGHDQMVMNSPAVKTEHAVISAVKTGIADAGISSAVHAKEAGLAFVPLTHEFHVLVARRESLEDERIQVLLQIVQSQEFRSSLEEWYTTSCTGKVEECTAESFQGSALLREGIVDPGTE
ncbi:MAG TPA: molybdopterin-binding protein [Methanoregulaceae archaeon]|nr:molybdopterin-binding protein [Methanoregulaceae archaeon]